MATRNSTDATEVNENDSILFPSADDDDSPNNMVNSESANSNQESSKTTSSRLTSSDKLSALPASSPNLNRILRSPGLGQGRAYRRSLDASSLPSDLEAGGGYGSPYHTWNSRLNGSVQRSSTSDGSYGHESPKKVSFDSDRISLPTIQSVRQALSRRNRGGSESVPQSPALRSSAAMDRKDTLDTPSPSRSRATSPLRLFHQWSTGLRFHHRDHEDPFVPVDPFRLGEHYFPRLPCFPSAAAAEPHIEISILTSNSLPHETQCTAPLSRYTNTFSTFMTDTLPRIVYLHALLRLPALYFSRVARIFEDAEVSKPDIQRMIDASARGRGFAWDLDLLDSMRPGNIQVPGTAPNVAAPTLPFPDDWTPSLASPALVRFKHSWEAFIDSLLREWKTLNVVSALLLSAILTMFQVPNAATDPVIRTTALLSLICALMSLSYGCMYIVRFGTMRTMYRASKWAEEARKANTSIFWNVWVLLAMPAVWMSWSMVFFIMSILSFVWRTGSVLDPDEREPLGAHAVYGPRIIITLLFAVGMIYFVMIVKTLKSYGTQETLYPRPFSPRVQPDLGEEQRGRRMERTPSTSIRRKEEPTSERGRRFESTDNRLSGVDGLGLIGMPLKDDEADFNKEVGAR